MLKFVEFTYCSGKKFALQPNSIKFIEELDEGCVIYTRSDRNYKFKYLVKESYDIVISRIAETVNRKVGVKC